MKLREVEILDGLRKGLGILVNQLKPGYGSINTGNTARAFFGNLKMSAEITGMDENLIKRFHIILQSISCGYEVNCDKFKNYTNETAKIFAQKYLWYYMLTSVHKLLLQF